MTEAALFLNVTRQAICVAMKKGRIKGKMKNYRWSFHIDELKDYRKSKYDRTLSKDKEGNLILDPSKGIYSPHQIAKMYNLPANKVYYWIYSGKLKNKKVGCSYQINIKDIESLPRSERDRIDLKVMD